MYFKGPRCTHTVMNQTIWNAIVIIVKKKNLSSKFKTDKDYNSSALNALIDMFKLSKLPY